jgi:ubiquinone/menaquinone biosynthesis C-methylase UbiE
MKTTTCEILPCWALDILACPVCHGTLEIIKDDFYCKKCNKVGSWKQGIAWFTVSDNDSSILWYDAKGGTDFQQRTKIHFTMSSLDAVSYHDLLFQYKPISKFSFIADVGSGDGRNTLPWVRDGYNRIIAIDPIADSLKNLRIAALSCHDDASNNLLLIRADARFLPLKDQAIDLALAIESLAYLNDDYQHGLNQCARVLKRNALLIVSETSREGSLIFALLYGGVKQFTSMQGERFVHDGPVESPVKHLIFTENELLERIRQAELTPVHICGLSLLSIIFGYLRGRGEIIKESDRYLPIVNAMLNELRDSGTAYRTHIVIASKQ